MVKKTVLKVDISCHKCRKKLLEAISGLQGVDKVEVDGGPSSQPPKEPYKPEEKKAEPKKADKKTDPLIMPHFHNPLTCPVCQQMHGLSSTWGRRPSSSSSCRGGVLNIFCDPPSKYGDGFMIFDAIIIVTDSTWLYDI
ncbi:hypothetical protein F3Y22_tig00111098pilonHSYRG00070 [Hibiscus syriacus]|uniref:HMA domain-containing protein n=1 Tax=Hibiscus syriacus TaxID=106335 RepID=A0A6A2Z1I4_HIBSY|nr:hypothetical protein F3Y22_tig00111098pilonHSYRG00070 [Hibiscus syriacus]